MILVHTTFPVNKENDNIIEFEDKHLRISSDVGVLILHNIEIDEIVHIFGKGAWRMAQYVPNERIYL